MFSIELKPNFIERAKVGALESAVFSGARSPAGFDYFWAVDRGRREVRPINARALRIVLPGGQVIFRKFARPSRPRFVTQRALANFPAMFRAATSTAKGETFSAWIRSFLDNVADFAAEAFRRSTPRVSGRLAQGYRVKRTGEDAGGAVVAGILQGIR